MKRLAYALWFVPLLLGMVILPPTKVSASRATYCNGPVHFNRGECYGYFTGGDAYQGRLSLDSIITNGGASLLGVNNASDFISLINRLLFVGGPDEIGAAFIVDTMLGRWGTDYGNFNSGIVYARANFGTWSTEVTNYQNGLGGSSVNWDVGNATQYSFNAPFQDSARSLLGSGSRNATSDEIFYIKQISERNPAIIFRNPDGTTYEIKKNCGNLVGNPSPLQMYIPPPPPSFSLSAGVSATIFENGIPTGSPTAQVGDQIQYTYTIFNNSAGPTTGPVGCTIYANEYNGKHNVPSPADTGAVDGPETAAIQGRCNAIIGPYGTVTLTETVSVVGSDVNRTICRSLYVSPTTNSGGTSSAEACVPVAAMPYFKVLGGDISAGNGFANSAGTCTSSNSAIISWNQRTGAFYPGAGTQYAALALNTIFDFASAQGTVTAGASAPSDLAFANNTITGSDKASGTFGRTFGAMPCATDYYAGKPASPPPASPNVAAMPGKVYGSTSGLNGLGGTVARGQRTVVYVQGDVYISGNIVYANSGTWSYANIPLFELVVKGNIYIDRGVTRLDGVYIAEPNGASGGTIYTCATGMAAPVDPTNPNFFSLCNTQLTVNGSFVSAQTRLLRTFGTLSNSTNNELVGATNAGEVFNFNPTVWVAQPSGAAVQGSSNNYDSITSLPPVL